MTKSLCIASYIVGIMVCFGLNLAHSEELGFGYTKRGEEIHFDNGRLQLMTSTRVDRPSPENVKGFSRALGRNITVSQTLDVASFEVLSEEYSRDKNRVFYKWISPGRFLLVELTEADVASFKPINFTYAVDKNSIWYQDRAIKESDPNTLTLISNRIVKDAKRVYISGEPQGHLDTKSFRHLGSAYFVDTNGVYWGNKPVVEADPNSFRVLGESFVAVDDQNVYRSGERQPHLDAGACKLILHDPYGYQVLSDKNGVYLNQFKFLHADPKDFKMIDNISARGGQYIFLVDRWHVTPVTVYKENDRLIASTVFYEKKTSVPLALVKAEVVGEKLKDVTLSPPPGETTVGAVPDWQLGIFQRADLVERMKKAGELLK
jgi:hypothetical protein